MVVEVLKVPQVWHAPGDLGMVIGCAVARDLQAAGGCQAGTLQEAGNTAAPACV